MAQSLVSIVTPAYNHERYIGQCIESVLSQTHENWEMFIIDDGSTDNTVAAARAYNDPRIKIFAEKNRGLANLAATYNIGVRKARGSLIAILEGDDYWAPRKLDIQVEDFEDKAVVLSWGRAVQVTEIGSPIMLGPEITPPWDARLNVPTGRSAYYMMSCNWQTFTFALTVMIRKSALDKVGGFQQPPYADYVDMPTFMMLSLEGSWRYHGDVLGYWRRHTLSTTRNRYPIMLNAAYRWCAEFVENYGDRIPATAAERNAIDQDWNFSVKDRLLALGRKRAAEGKFEEAISFFQKARSFRIGNRTHKMVGLASFLAKLHVSPEFAFRIGRQPGWETMVKAASGDSLVNDDMSPEDFRRYDLLKKMPPRPDASSRAGTLG